MRLLLCAAALCLAVAVAAQKPSPYATKVVAFDTKGKAGGGIFNPKNALGRPKGATDVHSLGVGGSLTLGFSVVIADGPGADLIVAENPFLASRPGLSFVETAFVEVSTNGIDFARVPARYMGPPRDPGPFAFAQIGWYAGLAGVLPVHPGTADPTDLVLAGGDAIDLAALRGDPLVKGGKVVLSRITQVRLVDAVSGKSKDARGVAIRDPGAGSADIDAVTVIHDTGSLSARGPAVALSIPASGDFALTIRDPDGLGDLDPATWNVALYGIRIPALDLLQVSRVSRVSPTSFTLRLGSGLPAGLPLQMSVSIQDRAGHHSGASATRPIR